jgi:fido (protein-threonine AMPylation protein)
VPGPDWSDDRASDLPRIEANCGRLVHDLHREAAGRLRYGLDEARDWHRRIYAGCVVPVPGYVGNVRGDPGHAELLDDEVGVGPLQPDGYPRGVGVWAADLAHQLVVFEQGVARAFATADAALPTGRRPATVDELHAVVALAAELHGEWIRLHPFANGNGRTARVWAAVVALRYDLPVFARVRPRPDDVAYARAARASMGPPPDFRGDHSATVVVFSHLLALALLP